MNARNKITFSNCPSVFKKFSVRVVTGMAMVISSEPRYLCKSNSVQAKAYWKSVTPTKAQYLEIALASFEDIL